MTTPPDTTDTPPTAAEWAALLDQLHTTTHTVQRTIRAMRRAQRTTKRGTP